MGEQRNRLTADQTEARRAKLAEMVRDGRYTWEQIADTLGYASRGHACTDYKIIRDRRRKETAQTLDEHRAEQLAGLEEIRRVAVEVMRRDHVHVSGGGIVLDTDDMTPLKDDGPTLAAIDRIAKIDAQIAQLLGLNAPTRIEAEGELKVIVEGVDVEGLK